MRPDELVPLVQALNPKNEKGKVTLITRLGAGKVKTLLPPFIKVGATCPLRAIRLVVLWF